MPSTAPPRPPAPLLHAHKLAAEAEDLYEAGHLAPAAQRFEAAAEQYVRATLGTADTDSLQDLRLLAIAHSQRAHELRCRLQLHDAQVAASESQQLGRAASSQVAAAAADPAASAVAAASGVGADAALSRLGSQLIGTLEALRLGAEELQHVELLLPPAAAGAAAALRGSNLGGSFCVVPSGAPGMSSAASSSVVVGGTGGGGGGPPSASIAHGGGGAARAGMAAAHAQQQLVANLQQRVATLGAENGRLAREGAALRQAASDMQAALAKVQRRAAEQARLSKKALAVLREVHAAPRADLADAAAQEVASLRAQLEAAHGAHRQQAALVLKYEQRWAQLKASARRKQAQQAQAAAKPS